MNNKKLLSLGLIALSFSAAAIAAETPAPKNSYVQHNFVANLPKYNADKVEDKFINAWGIAIRPAGAGGHFWVAAKDVSYEYIGDVTNSPDEGLRKLTTNELEYVKVPIGGADDNVTTGVVFSDSKDNFVITQEIKNVEPITAPAKFIFASDAGTISAWTERKKPDGKFDRSPDALRVIDESAAGAQFFGITLNEKYDTLYAANFGVSPGVKVYDGKFKPLPISFDQPFDTNKNGKVDAGEYAPFNVQQLKTPKGESHIFVSYAKTKECPEEEIKKSTCKKGEIFAGEEDTDKDGNGRLAEFTEAGKLVAIWPDSGKLSAPWGVAYAPGEFGALSGKLLVANFGSGLISAFDANSRKFVDVLRDKKGEPLKIEKIWGILFGNGESLGDKNALYFTAGPADEKEGVFGSLRAQ